MLDRKVSRKSNEKFVFTKQHLIEVLARYYKVNESIEGVYELLDTYARKRKINKKNIIDEVIKVSSTIKTPRTKRKDYKSTKNKKTYK